MQNDCDIYVDPEEDEVFFGCVSEREKSVCTKLVNFTGSRTKDYSNLCEVLEDGSLIVETVENFLKNEQSSKPSEEIFIEGVILTESQAEIIDSFKKSKDFSKNTAVEMEHNYSTPMKHKIDKSILTTPKSVFKADKDGGFLKVLSEIALVKAEAEGEKESEEKREDEDKENKLISPIPKIKITEATPEKESFYSPPHCVGTELRRFRIIYSSPQRESIKCKGKSSQAEAFESQRNYKNKCLDFEVLVKDNRKSIEPIDFSDFANSSDLNEAFLLDRKETQTIKNSSDENENNVEMIPGEKKYEINSVQSRTADLQHREASPANGKPPNNLRFSKEARKIVEVLKKSSVDDTLNFTVPVIDVEEENSFLSPEPVSAFEETVTRGKIQPDKSSPKMISRPAGNKLASKVKKTEEERCKLQPLKYFNEGRIYNQDGNKLKNKCVKLPLEEKWLTTEVKMNGGRAVEPSEVPSSRIPIFSAKNSRIPPKERVVRTPLAKTILPKNPLGKSYKMTKFNHIESPINAYIHNKPTSLVINVKPEMKKDSVAKVWKAEATGGIQKKMQEKSPKPQRHPEGSAVKLPFVDYKSGTAYKIEKRPESRLPRLAPTVMKLIGSHSPKLLRHEGRFYVNAPKKQNSTENSTIVADPNEVSVVVSQSVQKSNTIK